MKEALFSIGGAFWSVLGEMAPYLLFGFLVAGALSVLVRPETVERHLGGRGIWPVIKATLFGIPLPLCSCGVIPVAASLRRHRASRGATVSFLLSTPQTGVDSIFVTLSLLGPVFAVFRPLAAFFSGMIGGTLVDSLGSEDDLSQETSEGRDVSHEELGAGGKISRMLRYGFVTLPADIAKPMFAGLLIAGFISWIVPEDFFTDILGTGIAPKLIMMLIGIPIYVCATASVPVAAVLIAKGISPGAALVFLMTGPATNAAAIATIWKILGKRTAIIYLGTVAVLSILFGTLLDSIFTANEISAEPGMPWMMPVSIKTVTALITLAILLAGTFRLFTRRSTTEGTKGAERITLDIKGMTCTHCTNTIKRSLEDMNGVKSADVDLKNGTALITGSSIDADALCRTIDELGYKAQQSGGNGQ